MHGGSMLTIQQIANKDIRRAVRHTGCHDGSVCNFSTIGETWVGV